MSYNPTQWSAGDTVTSAKLNKIEQGISNNEVLEINIIEDEEENFCLNKTWQEIYNANMCVIISPEIIPTRTFAISVGRNISGYFVSALNGAALSLFVANTANDYPILQGDNSTDPVA